MEYRKVYVDVTVDIAKDGGVRPRRLRYENGKIYNVDELKHVCFAESTKVGGIGKRYTVVIRGQESYLFDERGKWFVEAKVVS